MESCPLVISHILAEFHPERVTYTTLHKFMPNLHSTYPIHIVVWGNFPFKSERKKLSSVIIHCYPQGMLKRRKDTSSVEVEEEDGVSPIKKKIPPHLTKQALEHPSPWKSQVQHPVAKATNDASSTFSPLRAGSKALFLEKNTSGASGKSGEAAAGTPSKTGLKTLFTPQRSSRVHVSTPLK